MVTSSVSFLQALVSICMYMYVNVCIMYVYCSICMYMYVYVCICMYNSKVGVKKSKYEKQYMRVYWCICMYMYVFVGIWTYVYVYIGLHIYIYTYIYWHGLGGNSESLPVMRARGASSSSYPYSCKCNWRGVWAEENGTMHWHALPVTSESVLRVAGRSRPTRTPSQAGRRLDSESEVAWTSLPVSIRLNSSGQSRSNLTESSSRSWPATIESVQPEARSRKFTLSRQLSGGGAAVSLGPGSEFGRQWTRARHSVRSHLARGWIRRTKCQAGRAAAKWQIIIFWRDTKPPTRFCVCLSSLDRPPLLSV